MAGTARILDVADAVAAAVRGRWAPSGPDGVSRVWAPDVVLTGDDASRLHTGRRVYVWPTSYATDGLIDRDAFYDVYPIPLLIVERYTDAAGMPPDAWVDERVGFTQRVFDWLRDPGLTLLGGTVVPAPDRAAEVPVVCDLEVLRQHRTFWSQLVMSFREVVEV